MKRYFEKTFFILVPFFISLFMAYLLGSFINVSFNPNGWTSESRQFMSFVGVIFGWMLYEKLKYALSPCKQY